MARATAHPDHRCISSEDIHGTTVYGADGSNLGEIDHLIIDRLSGRVAYAVMSFGGFMGLGHSHYPIPWGAPLRPIAWRIPHQYYGATTQRRARVHRRFLAGSGLGSSDPSSLRCAGILGDPRRHLIWRRVPNPPDAALPRP
jgi:PRC-barrel domain